MKPRVAACFFYLSEKFRGCGIFCSEGLAFYRGVYYTIKCCASLPPGSAALGIRPHVVRSWKMCGTGAYFFGERNRQCEIRLQT